MKNYKKYKNNFQPKINACEYNQGNMLIERINQRRKEYIEHIF